MREALRHDALLSESDGLEETPGLKGIAGLIKPRWKKRGNYEPIKGRLLNPTTERYNKPIAVNTMTRITRITMAIIRARHISFTHTLEDQAFYAFSHE